MLNIDCVHKKLMIFLIPRKLFDFWSVVKAIESPKFEMNKLECKLMLNDLKNFKKQLQELEAQIKESVLAQWYEQEPELGEKVNTYL